MISKAARQMKLALQGLTPEQRMRVRALLPPPASDKTAKDTRWGWSIYRMPTTIDPPTTLRLHYRDGNGKLQRVVSITENGVTK